MDRAKFLELIEPAVKLVDRKGEDYNQGIQLHEYFPFKDKSYLQMMHMKVLRMRSLLTKGATPNFDSQVDSLYDLINYAVFYLEYLQAANTGLKPLTSMPTQAGLAPESWRATHNE